MSDDARLPSTKYDTRIPPLPGVRLPYMPPSRVPQRSEARDPAVWMVLDQHTDAIAGVQIQCLIFTRTFLGRLKWLVWGA